MTSYDADFYKDTVFLPKTEFPMRGNLPEAEPNWLKFWQEIDLYGTLREQSKDAESFILHDGPPYANGRAHMGTAFQKTLKDMANRLRQMQGFNAPYVPGWDCHGLPIEWKVEEQYREKGQDKDDVPTLDFREECRQFAQYWVDQQREDFKRLGICANWDNPYLTMHTKSEASIAREIHKFLMNGSLYIGYKPVLWSPVEKTALAEAEVEYHEHKSVTVWVKFPVIQAKHEALKDASVVIWTTTPWTLPSNKMVAYGAEMDYALYEVKEVGEGTKCVEVGEKLLLSSALVQSVMDAAKVTAFEKLADFKGSDFEGAVCAHPLRGFEGADGFWDYDVPMLPGDFVTDEAGTGFVHCAPAHGADDFVLGQTYKIKVEDNVDEQGRFRAHVPIINGLAIMDKDGKLSDGYFAPLKLMQDAGALLAKGSLRHDYPHSWRSKAPVIFRATPQWFISMEENSLRDKALKGIEETRWIPERGETRIRSMVAERPDWCISRQRSWGVPIAVFVHKETRELLRDDAVNARIYDIFAEEGADAWWSRPASDFLGSDYNADDYEQVFDVVDVWFESGSTHAFVLEDREDLSWPADLYLEGSDQHRGWFQSSLLESVGTRGTPPYKMVVTNGFVLDEKGYKMSKSLGNVINPEDLWTQYGADIIRLWTASTEYTEDVRIGHDILKSSGDLYRRVRNTFRFLLGAMADLEKAELIDEQDYSDMPELEQFMLHQLHDLDAKMKAWIEDYDFNRITQALHHFCAVDLSAFYFDIRKDRLYCDRPDLFERRACRTVLYHIFDCLTAWFAPFLCFTAEEAWSHRPKGLYNDAAKSVHLRQFPELPSSWQNEALAEKWQGLRKIRRSVLAEIEPYRKDKTIGSSLEAHPHLYLSDDMMRVIDGQDMAEICITSQITVSPITDAPQEATRLNVSPDVAVAFHRAEGEKCQRCWKILPDVGTDPEFPNVSPRDADAVRWYLKHRKAA